MNAAAARQLARQILAESRFHQPSIPRPLHGLLESVGNVLESPWQLLLKLVNELATVLPGGIYGAWAVVAAIVIVAVWVVARASARGKLAEAAAEEPAEREQGPRALERAAAAAEREGRFAEAVRLRFRAGLLGLAQRRQIPSGYTVPTREVARILASARFESLARRFDEIAYGGAAASARDAAEQREGWSAILAGER